jgi:hypothetical protein
MYGISAMHSVCLGSAVCDYHFPGIIGLNKNGTMNRRKQKLQLSQNRYGLLCTGMDMVMSAGMDMEDGHGHGHRYEIDIDHG